MKKLVDYEKILILTQTKVVDSPPFWWYLYLLDEGYNVEFRALFGDDMGKEISNKFDLIKCLPDVIKILTSYDVVWSFHPIANLASRIARMLGAVTIVNELRCLKENIKPMGRFLDNQTICKADVLIANSLGVKDSYGIDRIKSSMEG